MTLSSLAKKLRLQDATRAVILGAPDGYMALLGETPGGLAIDLVLDGIYDFAQLFAKDRAQLDESIAGVLAAIENDAVLWICYPKGSSGVKSDLNRDKLWKALEGKGIRPVSQVSIDKTWSAMRFRPHDKVGT